MKPCAHCGEPFAPTSKNPGQRTCSRACGHAIRSAEARTPERLRARILKRVVVDEHGCWIWQGFRDANGYAKINVLGTILLTHRVAYEAFVGPIPEGLHTDHLCNRGASGCMNPEHVEPVTQAENNRRRAERRTHCDKGHEYTPENIRIAKNGSRTCRICANSAAKDRYLRNRDEHLPRFRDYYRRNRERILQRERDQRAARRAEAC